MHAKDKKNISLELKVRLTKPDCKFNLTYSIKFASLDHEVTL